MANEADRKASTRAKKTGKLGVAFIRWLKQQIREKRVELAQAIKKRKLAEADYR